jgi:hypothetical protein
MVDAGTVPCANEDAAARTIAANATLILRIFMVGLLSLAGKDSITEKRAGPRREIHSVV